MWFSIPNPTTLLTAQICSTKTNCISSRKAPVTDARSVNTKYFLFFSRRKLKQERGRRSESELFYQIQWGLEVSSISFSRVGCSYFNVSQYIKCKLFVSWLPENVLFIKLKRFALNVYGSSKVGLTSIL